MAIKLERQIFSRRKHPCAIFCNVSVFFENSNQQQKMLIEWYKYETFVQKSSDFRNKKTASFLFASRKSKESSSHPDRSHSAPDLFPVTSQPLTLQESLPIKPLPRMRFFQKSPPQKKTREKQWRNKFVELSLVLSQPHPFGAFFLRVFPGWEEFPKALLLPWYMAELWISSSWTLCGQNLEPEIFFTHATATWRFPPGGWWSFFFFSGGWRRNTLWTKTRNPPTNKQTSRKTIVERSIRTKPTPEISNDISRTRFEPVSSVRTFFTKVRSSLAKNMPPRSGFCSQKERLGTS